MNPDGRKIMHWNDSTDREIFLAILSHHDLRIDVEAVADFLGCSTRAVDERLKQLRKISRREADARAKLFAERVSRGEPAYTPQGTPVQKKRGKVTNNAGSEIIDVDSDGATSPAANKSGKGRNPGSSTDPGKNSMNDSGAHIGNSGSEIKQETGQDDIKAGILQQGEPSSKKRKTKP